MDKRFLLAAGLSFMVLMLWSTLVVKPAKTPISAPVVPTNKTTEAAILKQTEEKLPEITPYKVSQANYEVAFLDPQAAIKEIVFNKYQNYKFPLERSLFLENLGHSYNRTKGFGNNIEYVQSDNNKKIIKRFIFSNSNYLAELEIEVQNLTNAPLNIDLPLVLGVLNFANKPDQARLQDIIVGSKEQIVRPGVNKDQTFKDVKYVGIRDRYFCAIIESVSGNASAFVKKVGAQETEVGIVIPGLTIEVNKSIIQKFKVYIGPQDLKAISKINPEWSNIVHFGAFDVIAKGLLNLLGLLHNVLRNWGLAIIALSVLIYLLVYPLTAKQMRSMKEMQMLQPKIEEIRKLYKDNPQRLNKEVMELYKEHKVNPLGGCLPMILQIPVFFSLYQALMRSIALKGESFLWIKDLSEPDRLFLFPAKLPILGNEFNLLPILMAFGMFAQQKLSMPSGNSEAAEQQKIMLIIFPIMFGFIFYHMPSGLVLYWFVNSSLMLVNQLRISREK